MLKIVEQAALANNLGRVARVALEIGQLSGVEPELLRYAFEIICPGTLLAGAEIEIETPPLLLYCTGCETEYLCELEDLRCPACLGEQFEVLHGREMVVRSITGG